MRLQLYVLRELLVNFALSATFVYFVCAVGVVIQAFASVKVPLLIALKNVPLFLFLVSDVLTPLSFLVAVLFTYGRMSAENEFVALRAVGIHPARILAPVVLLGLAVSAVQLQVLSTTIPVLYLERNRLLTSLGEEAIRNIDPGQTRYEVSGLSLNWRRHEGLVFEDVWLKYEPKDSTKRAHGFADRVTLTFESTDLLLGIEGFRSAQGTAQIDFGHFAIRLPFKDLEVGSGFNTRLRFLKSDVLVARAIHAALRSRESDTSASVPQDVNSWRYERKRCLMELHRRAAWSMSALLFGLVGAPIALWMRRGTRLSALVVGIGLVFLVYFPLAKTGDAIADSRGVPYWVAAWLATGALTMIASVLVYRLCRR